MVMYTNINITSAYSSPGKNILKNSENIWCWSGWGWTPTSTPLQHTVHQEKIFRRNQKILSVVLGEDGHQHQHQHVADCKWTEHNDSLDSKRWGWIFNPSKTNSYSNWKNSTCSLSSFFSFLLLLQTKQKSSWLNSFRPFSTFLTQVQGPLL